MVTIDRIRTRAKECDITMNSICRKIGKGTSYFSDKETAGKEVPDDVLEIIAERLSTTVAYLKGETDEKKPALVSEGGQGGFNAAELVLIERYRCLNAEGQEKADDYLDDLLQSGRYKKRDSAGLGREA